VQQGHTVLVERGAGEGTGYPDADYEQAGATLMDDHAALFAEGDLVVKVKEPLPEEYGLMRSDQVLFTYFHLAADRELAEAVCRSGVTALAYETIEVNGRLPLFEATQSGAENRTPRRCRDNKCPVVMSIAFGQTN
jgi:alanine dehydrogenase